MLSLLHQQAIGNITPNPVFESPQRLRLLLRPDRLDLDPTLGAQLRYEIRLQTLVPRESMYPDSEEMAA